MTLLADTGDAKVYHATWTSLLDVVPECDALIVDAPYSARVHDGHDGQVAHLLEAGREVMRNALSYRAWTPDDVREFVAAWSPRTAGWIISITDHILARAWEEEMARVGRCVFPWLPFVASGSRVRLAGDGPSCWTTQIVVARPRTKAMAAWGTLPGAYVLPSGFSERMPVVGGKPSWLMHRLVEDYSRPGDLVVDPCCGAGTTAIGALRSGRRAVVGDALLAHAEIAAAWVKRPHSPAPGLTEKPAPGQRLLFEATK